MRQIRFEAEKVPYFYTLTVGGVDWQFEWGWNPVGRFFTLTVRDLAGAQVWRRPVLYGTDLLFGCAVPGLAGASVIPLDADLASEDEGVTLSNAAKIRVWMVEP